MADVKHEEQERAADELKSKLETESTVHIIRHCPILIGRGL